MHKVAERKPGGPSHASTRQQETSSEEPCAEDEADVSKGVYDKVHHDISLVTRCASWLIAKRFVWNVLPSVLRGQKLDLYKSHGP